MREKTRRLRLLCLLRLRLSRLARLHELSAEATYVVLILLSRFVVLRLQFVYHLFDMVEFVYLSVDCCLSVRERQRGKQMAHFGPRTRPASHGERRRPEQQVQTLGGWSRETR